MLLLLGHFFKLQMMILLYLPVPGKWRITFGTMRKWMVLWQHSQNFL